MVFGFIKKAATAPYRGARALKRKAERKMVKEIILMAVRHGLTALGAGGVMSNDELTQIGSALCVAVGLLWSAWRKIDRARKENSN